MEDERPSFSSMIFVLASRNARRKSEIFAVLQDALWLTPLCRGYNTMFSSKNPAGLGHRGNTAPGRTCGNNYINDGQARMAIRTG
jgi:hypothetical protein